jgi:hypothetical protein
VLKLLRLVSFSSNFIPVLSRYLMQALFGLGKLLGFCLHRVGVAHVEENANVWEMKPFFFLTPLLLATAYSCLSMLSMLSMIFQHNIITRVQSFTKP